MTYVMAGIRGNYTLYRNLLKKIHFGKKDFLFIAGDFTGAGDETFDLLEELSYAENIYPVASAGDRLAHEMLSGFDSMLKSGTTPDASYIAKMQKWAAEGGKDVLDGFRALDKDMKEGILDYLAEIPACEKVTVKEKDYLIVSAGVAGHKGEDPLELDDSAFLCDGAKPEFDGYTVLYAGYDGTDTIETSKKAVKLDCGAGKGGRLAVLRLEDGAEYYAD